MHNAMWPEMRLKDPRYGNRGRAFEDVIRQVNEWYKQRGIAVIDKIPTEFIPLRDRTGRVVSAKVQQKSSVDFIGRYGGRPIAFDAKSTNTERIELKRVEPHQADWMDAWVRDNGGDAFVLVNFGFRVGYLVPWVYWRTAQNLRLQGKMNVAIDGPAGMWTYTGKASIRKDEMHLGWKVLYDTGFDYLKVAKAMQGGK